MSYLTSINSRLSTQKYIDFPSSFYVRKFVDTQNMSHSRANSHFQGKRYVANASKKHSVAKAKRKQSKTKKKVSQSFCNKQQKQEKKKREVKFIPETIKFKKKVPIQNKDIFNKTMQFSKKNFQDDNKENDRDENNFKKDIKQKYIPNKDLLKNSLKPSRLNFMNKIANVYDLVLSKVCLPSFVQYFLGEALFLINKQNKVSNKEEFFYDWNLDQFKKICQKIYEKSEQEDLRYFMSISLPNICRWVPKINSSKANPNTVPIHTLMTTYTDSRISKQSHENRISFFKSLNKKDTNIVSQQIDVIDRLNQKLDKYLKNTCDLKFRNRF